LPITEALAIAREAEALVQDWRAAIMGAGKQP
jgi:hypothetical protein